LDSVRTRTRIWKARAALDPFTKEYDGLPFSYLNGRITAAYGGTPVDIANWTYTWYGEDETVLASPPADAGSYALVITADDDEYAGGVIEYFTIKPKRVSVSWTANTGYAYNGADQGGTVRAAYKNINNEDVNASVVFSGAGSIFKNAGQYTATAATADKNYALVNNMIPLVIAPKVLEVSISADGKTYDGTTAATGIYTLTGVVEGDSVSLTGGVYAFDSPNAGNRTVTFSGYGLESGNYALANAVASAPAAISRAVLTPAVAAVDSKTYDGTTAATGGRLRLEGWKNGEAPAQGGDGTDGGYAIVWTSKNAETTTVSVANIALDSAWTLNYELSATGLQAQTAPGGAKIGKRAVTVRGIAARDKDFDGKADAELVCDGAAFDGLIGGDELTVTARVSLPTPTPGKGRPSV
jgi:hypothetical protein